MGSVKKKITTRAMPKDAEIIEKNGERLARWKAKGKGKFKTSSITISDDGTEHIVTESSTYYAKYRDADGIVREVPTGCKDRQSAERILSDLEREADRIRSKIVTTSELRQADLHKLPIAHHLGDYLTRLRASGATDGHIDNVERYLKLLANEFGGIGSGNGVGLVGFEPTTSCTPSTSSVQGERRNFRQAKHLHFSLFTLNAGFCPHFAEITGYSLHKPACCQFAGIGKKISTNDL